MSGKTSFRFNQESSQSKSKVEIALTSGMPGRVPQTMIEAVENHTPEVIAIDEIGTTSEALAARTIAQRGESPWLAHP